MSKSPHTPLGGCATTRASFRPLKRLAGLLSGVAALTLLAGPAKAHVIANWTEAAARLASQEPRAPGPPDTRLQARVALAMFEAVNAVEGRYVSFLGVAPASRPASSQTAAARAAYEVLVVAHPARTSELSEALTLALATAEEPAAREHGEAVGRAAARAVLARQDFRPGDDPAYIPAAMPGRYIATDLPGVPPRTALARPYFFATAQAVAPSPPPPLRSARYGRDMEEVRRLGGKASPQRTPAQTALAVFWSRQDVLRPLRELTAAAARPLIEDARTYAMVTMAMDDASNAVATAKLGYGSGGPSPRSATPPRTGTPQRRPTRAGSPSSERRHILSTRAGTAS